MTMMLLYIRHILQWQKACETYKQAISTWTEYKEKEVYIVCAITRDIANGTNNE